MKIIASAINWNHNSGNEPEFHVMVDKLPDPDDLLYHSYPVEGDGKLLWHIDPSSSLVTYLLMYRRKPDHMSAALGFGGREFTRQLNTGAMLTSNNCWSSRAECLPFDAVSVEVREQSNPGHTVTMGMPTFWVALMIAQQDAFLIEREDARGEKDWTISTAPDHPCKKRHMPEMPDLPEGVRVMELNSVEELHDVLANIFEPTPPNKRH